MGGFGNAKSKRFGVSQKNHTPSRAARAKPEANNKEDVFFFVFFGRFQKFAILDNQLQNSKKHSTTTQRIILCLLTCLPIFVISEFCYSQTYSTTRSWDFFFHNLTNC